MNFIEELRWRGMIHDMMPGTEEQLSKEMTTAYIGYDPTSDSLHIGNLATIMMLKHFQICGHKPIVLVGGATGMIGDPSGKSEERNLLTEKELAHNEAAIQKQLEKFLDFDKGENKAEMVNNHNWMKNYNFLEFSRDIGKHISVNYMMAKDSVKKRLESGLSFTEFSYQLVQGYDFLHLYKNYGCKLQMGGSDQWGNITTGTELIRRKSGREAYALTCPLVTKADGGKFGKTEQGNVWLDREKTSPYKFYQFWLNTSDEDAANFIKVFTLLSKDKIEELLLKHNESPHLRILQKELAKEITIRVHSEEDYLNSVQASQILFGKGTEDKIKEVNKETLLSAMEGVPNYSISLSELENGIDITDLLVVKTNIFSSKGEARRMFQSGGLSINKSRVSDPNLKITKDSLLNDNYLLVQKGKKNYYLIVFEN